MNTNTIPIEYEATFSDIDVALVVKKIKDLNGVLIKSKFNQKRTIFNFKSLLSVKIDDEFHVTVLPVPFVIPVKVP